MMCGIAGCVVRRARPRVAAPRGWWPRSASGSGRPRLEILDYVGLGHTRLAIVDPTAAGTQPMLPPAAAGG